MRSLTQNPVSRIGLQRSRFERMRMKRHNSQPMPMAIFLDSEAGSFGEQE